jgi:hypothetical protein
VIKAVAFGTLAAGALAVGCQSDLLGPVKPDEPGSPPEQPKIEPFGELMPQEAYGPTGPRATRSRLVARLGLSPPNDGYSLFMSEIHTGKERGNSVDLWFRCQSVYVARTESFGKHGAVMGGGSTCTGGVTVRPSWSALELRQISCEYERQLTAGTVSADLEAVRITFSSGAVRTYRLDGPLLTNAAQRRVFLLDHGSLEWTLAEGLKDGRVVASERGLTRYCD